MIVHSLVFTALFYLALYPKRAGWGLEGISLTGVSPYFESRTWALVMDLHFKAKVSINNPNKVGSWMERSRYEIFAVWQPLSDVRVIGEVNLPRKTWIPPAGIRGGKGGSASIVADVVISRLTIPLSLRLLVSIMREGGIKILALGSAQVLSLNFVRTLVGIRCLERVAISFFAPEFAWMPANVSSSCQFTYQPLPRLVRNSTLLPFLDRVYVFRPLPRLMGVQ